MAHCLFDAEPLSQPMLGYCQIDPSEQTLNKIAKFSFMKSLLIISSIKEWPFCPERDKLITCSNKSKYWLMQCSDWGRTWTRLWTNKRPPIPCPRERTVGVNCKIFQKLSLHYNSTVLYLKVTAYSFIATSVQERGSYIFNDWKKISTVEVTTISTHLVLNRRNSLSMAQCKTAVFPVC